MPACLASTRNSVLSLTLVVTVAVTVTSNMPSAIGSAPSAEVDLDLRAGPARAGSAASSAARATDPSGRCAGSGTRGRVGVVGHAELSESKVRQRRCGRCERRGPAARPAGADYRVPASSGSRPPRRSSATRSSQPPTWVSPMKICGTVRRPVQLHHRLALAGLQVDADLVDRSTPRCFSSALARMQYGQTAVRVHLDGLHRAGRSGGLLDRQVGGAPGGQAAGQRRACSRSRASSARRRRAARARRSGRRRPAAATCSSAGRASVSRLAERHAARADRVAGGVFGRLADVDQDRLLAIDQAHRIGGADLRAADVARRASARAAGRRRPARRRTDTSCRERISRSSWATEPIGKARIIEFDPASRSRAASPHSRRADAHSLPMHKLVLIRHGESTWNLENRFTGWTDVDLTPPASSRRARPAGC